MCPLAARVITGPPLEEITVTVFSPTVVVAVAILLFDEVVGVGTTKVAPANVVVRPLAARVITGPLLEETIVTRVPLTVKVVVAILPFEEVVEVGTVYVAPAKVVLRPLAARVIAGPPEEETIVALAPFKEVTWVWALWWWCL